MKKIRNIFIMLLLIGAVFTLSACGGSESADAGPEGNTEEAETITIEHALGEAVVEKNPQNVVVFDYAVLDALDVMGVDITGLPKASIPTFLEQYNDEKYVDAGGLKEPNFEKIFELEPDVIFISGRQAEIYDQLSAIAPTVHFEVDGSDYMGSITKNITTLGEIFEKEDVVEEELAKINANIEDIREKVVADDKNALVVMANDGVMSAYGAGSRFGVIHSDFGFAPADEGIEVSTHGQSITFEYILEKNPEHVFVIDRAAVAGGDSSAKELFDNELIKQTDAYKNDNIHYLNSEVWYVASGGINGTDVMVEDINQTLQ